jgi:hypothetical protein
LLQLFIINSKFGKSKGGSIDEEDDGSTLIKMQRQAVERLK